MAIKGTPDSNHLTGTYTTIATLDATVRNGWNTIKIAMPVGPYLNIKFEQTNTGYQQSNCKFSEIQTYGYATTLPAITTSNIGSYSPSSFYVVSDDLTYDVTSKISYSSSGTPTINTVSPRYGSWKVANTLTITGSGFGTTIADVSVKVDGVVCAVSAVIDTSITCTIPIQTSEVLNSPGTFEVAIKGAKAINFSNRKFQFVSLWSDAETWGTDAKGVPPAQ